MAIELTEYFCPNCNSTKLHHRTKHVPKTNRVSMDELSSSGRQGYEIYPAVLIVTEMICECLACGYTIEYCS